MRDVGKEVRRKSHLEQSNIPHPEPGQVRIYARHKTDNDDVTFLGIANTIDNEQWYRRAHLDAALESTKNKIRRHQRGDILNSQLLHDWMSHFDTPGEPRSPILEPQPCRRTSELDLGLADHFSSQLDRDSLDMDQPSTVVLSNIKYHTVDLARFSCIPAALLHAFRSLALTNYLAEV